MNGLVLLCGVMALGFLLSLPWAIAKDRAEIHLMHRPGSGCRDCEAQQ